MLGNAKTNKLGNSNDFYIFYDENEDGIESLFEEVMTFKKDYNSSYISNLSIEGYSKGFGDNSSFSQVLDNTISNLISLEDYSNYKFGLFYSNIEEDFKYFSGSKNEDICFNGVKKFLKDTISIGEDLIFTELNSNDSIYKILQGKILYLYHPENFIPIVDVNYMKKLSSYLKFPHTDEVSYFELMHSLTSIALDRFDKSKRHQKEPQKVLIGLALFLNSKIFYEDKIVVFTDTMRNLRIMKEADIKVFLGIDGWNDHSYKTAYNMMISENDNPNNKILIGRTKIITLKDELKTSLEFPFTKLDETHCSLGFDNDFYDKLGELGGEFSKIILNRINDITLRSDSFIAKFQDLNVYSISLMRDIQRDDFQKFRKKLENTYIPIKVSETNWEGDAEDYEIEQKLENPYLILNVEIRYVDRINKLGLTFDFKQDNFNLYRINSIIGKNGVGKSTSLLKLFKLLSTVSSEYTEDERQPITTSGDTVEFLNGIDGGIPIPIVRNYIGGTFSKLIYISYGLFDGKEDDKTGFATYSKNSVVCNSSDVLIDRIGDLINGKSNHFLDKVHSTLSKIDLKHLDVESILRDSNYVKQLSSGYKMILSTVVDIIINIEPNSLVFFDEPETHLHPEFVGILIKLLYELLEEFNSYMIIGTHSPIIIQQIPSKYITKIVDNGDRVVAKPLGIESFGNNISEITYDVFGSDDEGAFYKECITDLYSKGMKREEILEFFGKKLSLNMRLFLDTLYFSENEKDTY